MHVGNLQAAAGRLQDALDQLQRAWQRTCDEWRDENSRSVEEELLQPLAEEVKGALPAIGLMSQTVQQAVRECSE
jgi:division protein CdvB (Snf7/Vps24/ESCRT-III family)